MYVCVCALKYTYTCACVYVYVYHVYNLHAYTYLPLHNSLVKASKEIEHGIVTSPFLHDLGDNEKIYKSQYFFIGETVEPIWVNVVRLVR